MKYPDDEAICYSLGEITRRTSSAETVILRTVTVPARRRRVTRGRACPFDGFRLEWNHWLQVYDCRHCSHREPRHQKKEA